MKTAFSTVLFVDGNPVGYQVLPQDAGQYIMNPAENPGRKILPPVLHVVNISGQWKVEGTINRDLIDQVLEEVTLNLNLPAHQYSAAP
jgi:hypothetical protein